VRAAPSFLVDDVLVNVLYADGLRALARLHARSGGDGARWQARAERTEAALLAHCRGDDGFFYGVDRRGGGRRLLRVRTVAGLTALLLPGLDAAAAAPLLRDLTAPDRFWPAFPVPSVAMDEPAFTPVAARYGAGPLLWRGPAWVNLNWLLVRALRRRGEDGLAERVAAASIALVRRAGFREHFNPHTGEGYGARSFGWSTLVVDMLEEGAGAGPPSC
jgi:glycogen debranching enzyme